MTPSLADQAERDRIHHDLDATLVVEAAAGTGKTTALVRRMVAVLAAGRASLDQIVAVTFTELAAGELKLRLRGEIEQARRAVDPGSVAHRCLTGALPRLEEARIGTIHSFCSDLLRERPVEAGVDPLFEVAAEDLAADLLRRAFDQWFERQLGAPGEGVRRILRRAIRDEGGPRERLRTAARELAERRDFPAPWRHEPFDRDAAIDGLIDDMAALGAEAAGHDPSDWFTRSLIEIARFVDEVRRREAVRGREGAAHRREALRGAEGAAHRGAAGRDYDGLEAELIAFARAKHWRWRGYMRGPDVAWKEDGRARRDGLHARLVAFGDAAGADLAPRLRDELWPVIERYGELKIRAGRLDFLDLLLTARDLLRDNPGVRHDLQSRFSHVFVDEFQDTDPLQAEILLLLAADDPGEADWTRVRPIAGKLFLVGDPKQSIYRFRRADVALYEDVKRRLIAAGAVVQHLTTSFRAVPEIQEAVNAALAPCMTGGAASQAAYVPLMPWRPSTPTQPAVIALPVPAPYGDYGTIVEWRIDESLPDAVAALVDWLVRASGWTVSERERPGERIPIAARHVCLLFRRFRSYQADVTHPYVRALEARYLPHVLVGGSSFHTREEIEAIRNALAAIERPDDELAVFATLRGPLFALGDGALLAFRERFRSLHPFRRMPVDPDGSLGEVAAALAVLRDLHRERHRRPIAVTVSRLLEATRAHAGFAIWPTGEQALANVTRLMDLARRTERAGITSFRRFVEYLAEEAERGGASDAPIIEEGTEGVRLMTVHRAKGLEFPVVVLADITAKEAPSEPSRYTEPGRHLCAMRLAGCSPPELLAHREDERAREREEATRILYVAATRARDLLIVPVVGDERREGWIGALSPAVYPADATRQRPRTRQPPGCPAFGTDSVVTRPERAPSRAQSVTPGLHAPERGTHPVVWWDPAVLDLHVEERVGLRQQKLLEVDESGRRSEEGTRAHTRWVDEQCRVRAAGARPMLTVVTATELAASAPAGGEPCAMGDDRASAEAVETVETRRTPGAPRPHGKRFGTLVHATLATVDLGADRAAVAAAAALQARLVGAPADETTAAVEAVIDALAHPLLRRAAAASGRCRREVAVLLRDEQDRLVEGVIDLAFRDDDAAAPWTVVDFKTDADVTSRLEAYRRQVGLYVRAVARATGQPARGVLVHV